MKAVHFHQADVRRAVQATQKAGLVVNGVEITRDGTIRILTGPAVTSKLTSLERWRLEHGGNTPQGA